MSLWTPSPTTPTNATWTLPEGAGSSQTQNSRPDSSAGRSSPAGAAVPSNKIKYQGKRFGQIVKLKPECYDEYKACHTKVWPEVLRQIKACNIEDYSIFYDDNSHILFASFKYMGYDYAGDMEKMRENDKVREWWKMTDAHQESLVEGAKCSEEGKPGWWKPLEEMFYYA